MTSSGKLVGRWGSHWNDATINEKDWNLLRVTGEAFSRARRLGDAYAEFRLLPEIIGDRDGKGFVITSQQAVDIKTFIRAPSERITSYNLLQNSQDPTSLSRFSVSKEMETACHFYYTSNQFDDVRFVEEEARLTCLFADTTFVLIFRVFWQLPLYDLLENVHFGKKAFEASIESEVATPIETLVQFAELCTPRLYGAFVPDPFA